MKAVIVKMSHKDKGPPWFAQYTFPPSHLLLCDGTKTRQTLQTWHLSSESERQGEVLNGFMADGEISQKQRRKTVMFYSK